MLKNLEKLISFKTLTDNKEENIKALEWVSSQIPKGYKRKIVIYNNHPSLIVGEKSPKLCLQGHIDVVPAKDDFFRAKIVGSKLYGRGAYDMKFAIACFLEVLKELDPKKHSIGMLITSDEEMGGFYGVKKVLEDGYSPENCIIPDGGENWKAIKRAKGVLHLKIEAAGKPGHASYPWEGDSANQKLLDFLQDLRKGFTPSKKDDFKSTINIGVLQGGVATNQIAESAFSKVDIRFTDKKEERRIKEKINQLKKKYKGVKVEEIAYGSSFLADTKSKLFVTFKDVAKKNKRNVLTQLSHSSSDARFFGEKRIPTLIVRPKGGGAHSQKEWVDVNDLEIFCKTLKDFAKKIS